MITTGKQARSLTGYRVSKPHNNDFHPTPVYYTQALLNAERIPGEAIWECACGDGAMARVLEAAGYTVIGTDLQARGYGQGGVDFLLEFKALAPVIVTNPPYRLVSRWLAHSARLRLDYAAYLLPIRMLAGEERLRDTYAPHPLARVLVFSGRGPRMHRPDWDGPDHASSTDYAWFIWDGRHAGEPVIRWIA